MGKWEVSVREWELSVSVIHGEGKGRVSVREECA